MCNQPSLMVFKCRCEAGKAHGTAVGLHRSAVGFWSYSWSLLSDDINSKVTDIAGIYIVKPENILLYQSETEDINSRIPRRDHVENHFGGFAWWQGSRQFAARWFAHRQPRAGGGVDPSV